MYGNACTGTQFCVVYGISGSRTIIMVQVFHVEKGQCVLLGLLQTVRVNSNGMVQNCCLPGRGEPRMVMRLLKIHIKSTVWIICAEIHTGYLLISSFG